MPEVQIQALVVCFLTRFRAGHDRGWPWHWRVSAAWPPAAAGIRKATLKASLKAALRFGHNYVGTEHLLLGVLDTDRSAAEALAGLGLTRQTAERLVNHAFEEIRASRKPG